jgi:hypothetical protein
VPIIDRLVTLASAHPLNTAIVDRLHHVLRSLLKAIKLVEDLILVRNAGSHIRYFTNNLLTEANKLTLTSQLARLISVVFVAPRMNFTLIKMVSVFFIVGKKCTWTKNSVVVVIKLCE